MFLIRSISPRWYASVLMHWIFWSHEFSTVHVVYDGNLNWALTSNHLDSSSWISRGKIRGLGTEFDLDQSGVTGRLIAAGKGGNAKSHKPAELGFQENVCGNFRSVFSVICYQIYFGAIQQKSYLSRKRQTGVKWRKNIISGCCVTNTVEQLPSIFQLIDRAWSPALRFCCQWDSNYPKKRAYRISKINSLEPGKRWNISTSTTDTKALWSHRTTGNRLTVLAAKAC